MTKELTAHQFSSVYKDMGIEVSDLGCIMLDLYPMDITSKVPGGKNDLYKSPDKKKFWIDGAVAEKTPHVTLLYGLMEQGPKWKKHVDAVLDGWSIKSVRIDHVDYFPNHYEDEDYHCIVAHVVITPELKEANARLKFLPHIDTFPDYKAHVTLAYIKGNDSVRNKWIKRLNDAYRGKELIAKQKLNYGGNKGE